MADSVSEAGGNIDAAASPDVPGGSAQAPKKKPRKTAKVSEFFPASQNVERYAVTNEPLIPADSWFRTQKDLLASPAYQSFEEARRTGNNTMVVVTRDATEKCIKEFAVVNSWETVYNEIQRIRPDVADVRTRDCRNFYEMFMKDQHVKPFIDFEIKGPFDGIELSDVSAEAEGSVFPPYSECCVVPYTNGRESDTSLESVTEEESEAVGSVQFRTIRPSKNRIMHYIGRIIHRIKAAIKEYYDIDILDEWFAYQDSSNNEKVSFHVVLTRGVYFRDCGALKNFFNKVVFPKELIQDVARFPEFVGFDPSVYAVNRQFRLPLCTKYERDTDGRPKVRPLLMDPRFSWDEQIVTYCPSHPMPWATRSLWYLSTGVSDEPPAEALDKRTVEILEEAPAPVPVVDFNPKEHETRERIRKKVTTKAPALSTLDTTDTVEVRAERDLPAMLFTIPVEAVDDYALWVDTGIKFKRAGGKLESWVKWTTRYCTWKFVSTGHPSKRADPDDPCAAHERVCTSKWNGFDPTFDLHIFLAHVERHGTGRVRYTVTPATDTTPAVERDLNGAELVELYKESSLEHIGLLHNEIAQAFMLKHANHVYSNGNWYFFDGTRWLKDPEGMWLSRNILRWQVEINMKLKELKEQYAIDEEQVDDALMPPERRRRGADADTEENFGHTLTEEEKRKAAAQKLAAKLKAVKRITQDASIGNNHALRTLYFNDRFVEDLETRLDLLAFRNGVFDLETNTFRDARREDYIVLSTKYDYVSEESIRLNPEEHNKYLRARRLVERLLRQVYPDASLRRYVRRFHSSLLTGRCPNEYVHFFTGVNSSQTGANGKSTIDLLLLTVLGEYAVVGHPSLLTGSREAAGGTNSAMIALRWKRYVSFQEVNDSGKGTMTLNMQVIKGLTGGDPQTARDLYEKQSVPFLPTWKVSVSANKLPPMNSDEGGARRRIRDIPHVAKFVPADEFENPEWESLRKNRQLHKMDPRIKEEIRDNPYLRLAYMHILLADHVNFRKGSSKGELVKCKAVEEHTVKYLKAQDVWRTWMEEVFEQVAVPTSPAASPTRAAEPTEPPADPHGSGAGAGAGAGAVDMAEDDFDPYTSDEELDPEAPPEEPEEELVEPTPAQQAPRLITRAVAETLLLQSDLLFILARQRKQIMSYGLTVRREEFLLELGQPTRLGVPQKSGIVYEIGPDRTRVEITQPHWFGWKITDAQLVHEIIAHRATVH